MIVRRYVCIDAECPPAERFMVRVKAGSVGMPFHAAGLQEAEAQAAAFLADQRDRAARRAQPRRRPVAQPKPAPEHA